MSKELKSWGYATKNENGRFEVQWEECSFWRKRFPILGKYKLCYELTTPYTGEFASVFIAKGWIDKETKKPVTDSKTYWKILKIIQESDL